MAYLPTTIHQPPDYHWSQTNQRRFLEQLASTGNISEAAKSVTMSTQAAHAFRNRAAGTVFKLGWDAAILLARKRLEGDLLERALVGQEEIYEREPDTGKVRRIRSDNRLSMGMLHRLDKIAVGKGDVPADTAMALIVSQDFESFLDLVERDGGRAEAMLFLKTRDGGLVPMVNVTREELLNNYQLAQNSAGSSEVEKEKVEPEAAASRMSVWFCDEAEDFRTDFPPPQDYDGEEEGYFGQGGYERSLSDEEMRIQIASNEAAIKPLRDAGKAAHERWFADEETEFARAEVTVEAATMQAELAQRRAEQERTATEMKAAMEELFEAEDLPEQLPLEPEVPEPEVLVQPEDNPDIRVIHCKPQPNYPAMGMIPPWAERIY